MSEHTGWIGVDLDGTLAHYDGWQGIEHIGLPVPLMLERVLTWLDAGIECRIFTARCCSPDPQERSIVVGHIHHWCKMHGLPKLQVTCVKDFNMMELWDDRAVQVIPNTGERADGAED